MGSFQVEFYIRWHGIDKEGFQITCCRSISCENPDDDFVETDNKISHTKKVASWLRLAKPTRHVHPYLS